MKPGRVWLAGSLCLGLWLGPMNVRAQDVTPAQIGVVVMHGKGGRPDRLVGELAAHLQARGFLVRNLEMPWSGRRNYDASPDEAQAEVAQAWVGLQGDGATRLFLVGHSQGGLYALHLGARLPLLTGVVAVAPGGNVGSVAYEEQIGVERARARASVEAGRGAEIDAFADYEGSKGKSTVRTRAEIYWAWFDPQGVMNQERALRALPARMPVLYIAPTGDYPALQRVNPRLYALLSPQALTRLLQPAASHAQAPTVAREAIANWLVEVATASPALH
ncbi:alpha/beta hydrolase [Hylemonella gracilis]|uniref:Alpha/beta hydrolase n=1 Tax=Hylemonella gracilis TaxID=80880 RepID=A0A4P6UJP8_9BURK|nr:alpha/beta hydrolase [Hylemonella gracilis]QBK04295.1 alpha/beta hydrolase [Hylemonella gracilis]